MISALVLCGGLGTRLSGVVDDRPKALAPIIGQPFLHFLLASLRRQGIDDVVLSAGHLGHMVEDFAGDGSDWGLRLRVVSEPEPLGTGGAIRFAADVAGLGPRFVAVNGDTIFTGSLARLIDAHTSFDASASLALVKVGDASRFGTVSLSGQAGPISAFNEKRGLVEEGWINAGVYVLERDLVDSIPAGQKISLERDMFPKWIGASVIGLKFPSASILDIGTPDDYRRAPEILRELGVIT